MSEKRKIKPLEELDVIDDFLFYELMSNPTSAQLLAKLVIERALGLKIGKLVIEAQKVVNGVDTDCHGIRMDVRAVEEESVVKEENEEEQVLRVFDIEPNNTNDKHLPRRDRYYQALNDVKLLEIGTDYEKLPELWSIWILPYDPFKANRMIYFVKNTVEDLPEIVYNDGVTKVFLYTRGTLKGSESLKSLLEYIHNTTEQNASDSELKQLHTQVQSIKHQKDIGVKYMRLMDSIERQRKLARKEGLEEGHKQGLEEGHKQGLEEGHKQGRKEGLEQERLSSIDKLMKVLKQKGTVSVELNETIIKEQDIKLINTWFDLALEVSDIEEFISKM